MESGINAALTGSVKAGATVTSVGAIRTKDGSYRNVKNGAI